MGVYEDMANEAGCAFGTDENRQMAQMIECQREQAYREQCEEEQCEEEQ